MASKRGSGASRWRVLRRHSPPPCLKRLLADIEASKIDVVVVYKMDRLSRSLMDFSRLVEVFDQHKVTFVSVTQSFNTTTSMGRLTLNILLSFAQFEREVIRERIRDKFAASRKRGMWMGGWAPLGYEVKDRKLIVNEADARLVRSIFQRFLKVGSATTLPGNSSRRTSATSTAS
jgi:site-specific DNA recombinase